MKVMCGAPCAKFPTYAEFFDSFAALEMPEGSLKMRATGGSIPLNLNTLVDNMFAHDCSHLFIVEDDSSFAPDTLMQLLAHDVPVVAGLCRARQAPFRPYIYSALDPDTGLSYQPLTAADRGLIKVAATGMGGILIKREVFEQLSRPYFSHYHVGEREWGQDIMFGKSLIDAGIDVYCDTDVIIWHATQAVIGSSFAGGKWGMDLRVNEATFRIVLD